MMKRSLFAAFSCLMLLSSCVDNNYTLDNGVDGTFGIDGALAVPLVKADIKLIDLMPDDFGDFKLDVQDDNIFLRYSTQFDVTADFIENVHFTPSEEFTLPVPWMPEGFNVNYEYPLKYVFKNINKEGGGQRLDSLLYADGQILYMYMNCDYMFEEGSYLKFKMNPDQIVLNPAIYPDNTVTCPINGYMGQHPIDLSGAKVIFDGGNELDMTLELNLIAAEDISGGEISNYVDFATVMPKVTYGVIYEGTVICENITKSEPFTYFNELQTDDVYLPVYNPVLDFTILNSIGVKAEYNLNYVKVNGINGEEVYADFNGSRSTSVNISSPELSKIEDLPVDELLYFDASSLQTSSEMVIDRDFGHTEKLFTVQGKTIDYNFTVTAAEETHGSFLFNDSKMLVDIDSYLPLRFEGDKTDPDNNFRLIVRDTVEVDFSSLAEFYAEDADEMDDEFLLQITHTNHLPVDTEFSMVFLDESDKPLLSDAATTSFRIDGAPVNAAGEVTEASATSKNSISVLGMDCGNLIHECTSIAFAYKINSEELDDIWFHTNDWLQLQIGAYLKTSIVISGGASDEGEDTGGEYF